MRAITRSVDRPFDSKRIFQISRTVLGPQASPSATLPTNPSPQIRQAMTHDAGQVL